MTDSAENDIRTLWQKQPTEYATMTQNKFRREPENFNSMLGQRSSAFRLCP